MSRNGLFYPYFRIIKFLRNKFMYPIRVSYRPAVVVSLYKLRRRNFQVKC